MRMREILEGEILTFKPKRRKLRHEIDVLKIAKPGNQWAVFVQGHYFNAFKTEEEAVKVASAKEDEFDRLYKNGNIRYQIIPVGRDYILLDRGVRVGVFGSYTAAEKEAEKFEPGSVKRMIQAWYKDI